MTETQLIQNIAKSNQQANNYAHLVRQKAYNRMVGYNNMCKYYNRIIDNLRQQDKLTDGTRKCNKKTHKIIYITKYTKKFRYISYRQALAIEYNTLEKYLASILELKDYNRQRRQEYKKMEQRYRICKPEEPEDIDDYEIDELD